VDQKELVQLIREVTIRALATNNQTTFEFPIAVSNRHIHLSKEHVERLFGRNYQLNKWKDLSQPGQFASKETVTLIGPKGKLEKVRVLGPARGNTQIEISLFDGYTLGITPPIRDSGDIDGTPSINIQGPRGQLKVDQGLICAARHIHMNPDDAARFQVANGQRVQVKVTGQRGVIFDNVLIRVSPKYKLEMHIDVDEANAAQIKNGQLGVLIS
jgi:putative phosphotransacetylase